MCELLAQPFGSRASVLRIEQEMGGAGHTYDTLVTLRQQHPDHQFALALGADITADTPRWYRWDDITAIVPIIVVGRAGYPHPDTTLELPAIASRQVRSLARRGASLQGLVPQSVATYITAAQLYG